MEIREAGVADAAPVAALLTELGYPASAADVESRLATSSETVLLADIDGETAGVATLAVSCYLTRRRPAARVTALVVSERFRRRGVGKALMERARAAAVQAGCEGIELTSGIRPEREAAHRFYESLGYQRTSYRFWLPL